MTFFYTKEQVDAQAQVVGARIKIATNPTTLATAIDAVADRNLLTDSERAKLASLESSRFLGSFLTVGAIPTVGAVAGSYADVDTGAGNDTQRYIYDTNDGKFVKATSTLAGETSASIKTKYEANANTNAFTDTLRTKLDGIADGATVAPVLSVAGKTGVVSLVKGDVGLGSVDNTTDAAKPVSTAQATAIALKANLASPAFTGIPSAPTAAVNTNTTQLATTAFVSAKIANDSAPIAHVGASGTAHATVTTATSGFMSAADKVKLDTIATGATANTGTVTSVTGTGAITSTGGTTPSISIVAATTVVPGTMSAADKAKLDGIVEAAGITSYTAALDAALA